MKRLFFMIPLIVLFGGCSLFRPPEPVAVGGVLIAAASLLAAALR